MRNRTQDLRILRSDALPLSHKDSTVREVYEVHMTRVLHTAWISNVDSVMFVNRTREMVSFELRREIQKYVFLLVTSEGKRKTFLIPHEESNIRPSDSALTLVSLARGLEHRSAESEGLRLDSPWGLRSFSLSQARDKAKNIFLYFFTELKTYHISYSRSFSFAKYAQFQLRNYDMSIKKKKLISIIPAGYGTYKHGGL